MEQLRQFFGPNGAISGQWGFFTSARTYVLTQPANSFEIQREKVRNALKLMQI